MTDVIKINVPTFLRILELVREDVKSDLDLHYIAEVVTEKSCDHVVNMDDYNEIVEYSLEEFRNAAIADEIDRIKHLSRPENDY